jgi:DNA polymerase I-like protein with 3'-5' exonuclease and polymerase domains
LFRQRIKISYQCHDEWLANVKNKEETRNKINFAIDKVNEDLKLNVKIGCSVEFGENYANCH